MGFVIKPFSNKATNLLGPVVGVPGWLRGTQPRPTGEPQGLDPQVLGDLVTHYNSDPSPENERRLLQVLSQLLNSPELSGVNPGLTPYSISEAFWDPIEGYVRIQGDLGRGGREGLIEGLIRVTSDWRQGDGLRVALFERPPPYTLLDHFLNDIRRLFVDSRIPPLPHRPPLIELANVHVSFAPKP